MERYSKWQFDQTQPQFKIRNLRVNVARFYKYHYTDLLRVLTSSPIVERLCNMLRALFLISAARVISGIIVKDPLPTADEYKYPYEIQDQSTGGIRSQYEVRHGGLVSGAFTTVHYTEHPAQGFRAVLVKEPVPLPSVDFRLLHHLNNLDNFYINYEPSTVYTSPGLAYLPRIQAQFKTFKGSKYFTPAYELPPDKIPINGLYFEPNKDKI